jgi:23S rRNA pseudouridine2605 synthase
MEEMRLQKFLSEQGVLSRRAAEEEIKKGKVKVNGVPATLGTKINPDTDIVEYQGRQIGGAVRKVYLMLNKPVGYVTTMSDEKGRPCVAELVENVGTRVYPIGRLDLESEGLLLFTNDGALANRLMHPKFHKPKIYHVKIRGEVDAEKIKALGRPMNIDGYITKPAGISIVTRKPDYTVLAMELFEGRNRQIRKMCEKVGLTVKRLCRISVGPVKLDGLPVGKWRYLSQKEVDALYSATKLKK